MSDTFDMVLDTKHYKKKYLIPTTLQSRVCMCDDPGPPASVGKAIYRFINHCAHCLKPYRYNIRVCKTCSKQFIKDFRRDDLDCHRHVKCWPCMQGELCDCPRLGRRTFSFEPFGLNPKVYSEEERKGLFSFDLPF